MLIVSEVFTANTKYKSKTLCISWLETQTDKPMDTVQCYYGHLLGICSVFIP
jgi:hypothetical protein